MPDLTVGYYPGVPPKRSSPLDPHCPICKQASVDSAVYLPKFGNVFFCKDCLLALPAAIVVTLADVRETIW